MIKHLQILLFAASVVLSCGTALQAGEQLFADLGDFRLESGEVIKDCRLAYRTMGSMNKNKSNIVLMTTWLSGTSQELVDMGFIGDGRMLDTRKYYVIAIDALGNGVSSSPSNSTMQPYDAFPLFSIRDMVDSQHMLLTKYLKINHVYAVAGISMGGMQTFQWMVSYPGFMDRAVSIEGTPWLTSYDMLAWHAELSVIDAAQNCGMSHADVMKTIMPIHELMVWTPAFRAGNTKPADLPGFIAAVEKEFIKYNDLNWEWQLRAILRHDILKAFDGSTEKAAAAVKARSMIITSRQDMAVYPGPSIAFAAMINAEAPQLTGDCGHFEFLCETAKLDSLVNGFLSKP